MVLRFLWLFVRLEVLEVVVPIESRGGVILGVAIGLPLLVALVRILLLHESLSSLKRFSSNVLGSLWEELTKGGQVALADAHKDDIWQLAHLLVLLGVVAQGSENDVGLQVEEDLVVTEVTEFRKIEDWLFILAFFAALISIELNNTLSDEEKLLNITLVADDSLSWSIDSAVHVNDELVGETSLALIEEMVERLLEFLEDSGVLNQVGLHLWCDLLIELEFFNDQVEIVHEGLLDILSDIVVESWLDVEWLVGFLNLLDPHIKLVQLLLDQIIEIIRCVENTINRTHKEREESETKELKNDGEDVLG